MRVLLVEDDVMIADALQSLMRSERYAIDHAADGVAADMAVLATGYDLVLLDLGLPRLDGIELLRKWRARGLQVPVLIMTARDATADRVKGLDAGADDYIIKPFDFEELLARMRALLRRASEHASPTYDAKGIRIDPVAKSASVCGKDVSLTAREWSVLLVMLRKPGQFFSREKLEESLYGWDESVSSNAIEVYIHGLRKKLGSSLIESSRGIGYRVPKE